MCSFVLVLFLLCLQSDSQSFSLKTIPSCKMFLFFYHITLHYYITTNVILRYYISSSVQHCVFPFCQFLCSGVFFYHCLIHRWLSFLCHCQVVPAHALGSFLISICFSTQLKISQYYISSSVQHSDSLCCAHHKCGNHLSPYDADIISMTICPTLYISSS